MTPDVLADMFNKITDNNIKSMYITPFNLIFEIRYGRPEMVVFSNLEYPPFNRWYFCDTHGGAWKDNLNRRMWYNPKLMHKRYSCRVSEICYHMRNDFVDRGGTTMYLCVNTISNSFAMLIDVELAYSKAACLVEEFKHNMEWVSTYVENYNRANFTEVKFKEIPKYYAWVDNGKVLEVNEG